MRTHRFEVILLPIIIGFTGVMYKMTVLPTLGNAIVGVQAQALSYFMTYTLMRLL